MARNAIMAEVIMMKSYLQNEGVITDEPCRLELCHELCKNIDDRFSNLDVEMLHIAQTIPILLQMWIFQQPGN